MCETRQLAICIKDPKYYTVFNLDSENISFMAAVFKANLISAFLHEPRFDTSSSRAAVCDPATRCPRWSESFKAVALWVALALTTSTVSLLACSSDRHGERQLRTTRVRPLARRRPPRRTKAYLKPAST